MPRFKRSVYVRIVAYSLALVSIVLLQAGVDIYTLRQVSRGSVALESSWVQGTTLLGDIDFSVEAFRMDEVQRVLALGTAGRDAAENDAAVRRAEIAGYEYGFKHLGRDDSSGQLAAFDRAWAKYQADHDRWLAGGPDEMALPYSTLDSDDRASNAAMSAAFAAYSHAGAGRAAAGVHTADLTMRFNLSTVLVCILLAVLTQLGARRQLILPLRAITETMTQLAAGQRNTAVPGRERSDEIGEMAAACEVFRLNVVALGHAHEVARLAEEQAQQLARHDALTGLPNRRVFSADLETALLRVKTEANRYALLLIDLDDFKKVNDLQGHLAGDIVLCEIARRLERAVPKSDTLARLGGDEFAIITLGLPDPRDHAQQVSQFAASLISVISEPIEAGDVKAQIGASIGIATMPTVGTLPGDVTSMLRAADIAMYRAKQSGRSCFRFFEQSMDNEMRERISLERDIIQAINEEAIRPHYQPLVDIRRRRIRSFEALARWHHPVRGNVPPDQFIPIIEHLGLAGKLSSSILRQSCRDARLWPADISFAINVSPLELRDATLAARFAQILHEENMPATRLEVEITESALVADMAAAKSILCALQAQGITISLDDFGTGYASLYHLRELKFDKVKIDRSFVHAMRSNAESEKIIDAILGLASSLKLPVVAEGIEDDATLQMLTAKGCDLGQGYYFGKAMPAAAAAALLSRGLERIPA